MTVSRSALAAFLAVVVFAPSWTAGRTSDPGTGDDPTAFVDPFVGTLGGGFTFPGPAAPFGMVQLSPDTGSPLAYTGYAWSDAFITGFSHVHVESMGVPSAGDVPFMPTIGPVLSSAVEAYRSPFSHADEEASPGYYRVKLLRYGIDAELTAGLRVGMHRYTFPPVTDANVIVHAGRSVPGRHAADVAVAGDRAIEGTAYTTQGYEVHFRAEFDRPIASFGAWDRYGQAPVAGRASASGEGAGLVVTFDATRDATVIAKVGISFVRVANAKLNLDAELPGEDFAFDALRARTRAAWRDALSAIRVRADELTARSFYTATYHAQHHPNVFTDANGEYAGHDGRAHQAGEHTQYANFSLWDTYRGENQLLALVAPDRYRDMVRSLLRITEQAGRLPQWALMDALPDFMVGEPIVPTLADAWCRHLVPADADAGLWSAVRRAMIERRRDAPYLEYGYVPHDLDATGTSTTLEHAIADFALALVADARGEDADANVLLRQSGYWRNVFDAADSGFVRPRLTSGAWVAPYVPEHSDGFVEGTGWQYTWLAPHDVAGLAAAMGADRARARLDVFLGAHASEAAPGAVPEAQKYASFFGAFYAGNQYAPTNEHDLQAPYYHAFLGEPWKTQAAVRSLQQLYRPTPDGLPGNDDLGTLSAWYVWSALGFYPAIAGAPLYVIGSPAVEEAAIRLERGTFTVRAPGASVAAKHVAGAALDGRAIAAPWFLHRDLADGGAIEFAMSATPTAWGATSPPPSASTHGLSGFGCGT